MQEWSYLLFIFLNETKQILMGVNMKIEELIRNALIDALIMFEGNRTKVANFLGLSSRTVKVYIHRFNLTDTFYYSVYVNRHGNKTKVENVYASKKRKDPKVNTIKESGSSNE